MGFSHLGKLSLCQKLPNVSLITLNAIFNVKVGYVHYFCVGAGILCEATGFANNEPFDIHIQEGIKHTIQVNY